MPKVNSSTLPSGALLSNYCTDGCFTDCYVTEIPVVVSQEQFVFAFYTTALFKLERFILKWAVSRPSTDVQAAQLASGHESQFAAWSVENRSSNQLLLSDFRGRTRSWLMTSQLETETGSKTRLYFGSAIVPVQNDGSGEPKLGFAFKSLVGFHKLYSVALLSAAAGRLIEGNR